MENCNQTSGEKDGLNHADKDRILKYIDCKFPVSFDAEEDEKLLFKKPTVETVVMMCKVGK